MYILNGTPQYSFLLRNKENILSKLVRFGLGFSGAFFSSGYGNTLTWSFSGLLVRYATQVSVENSDLAAI